MHWCRAWADTSASLDRGWYHLRTPLKPCHTLTSGTLTLHGNAQTLDNIDSPAALFRKQKHYAGIWSAVLTFEPDNECEEAGTTIYYGVNSYAAVLVRKKGQGREVVARWKDEDIAVKVSLHEIAASSYSAGSFSPHFWNRSHYADNSSGTDDIHAPLWKGQRRPQAA